MTTEIFLHGTEPTPEPTKTQPKKTSILSIVPEPPKVMYKPTTLLDAATGLTGKHLGELRAETEKAAERQIAAYAKQGKTWKLKEHEAIPNRPSKSKYEGFIEIDPEPYRSPRFGLRGTIFSPPNYVEYLHTLRRFHAARYGRLRPFRGPVSVEITFYFHKPKNKTKVAVYADNYPDIDNCVKAFLDSLDFLNGLENKQRSKARKRLGELAKWTAEADPRKDLFPPLEFGKVLANDAKVVELHAVKKYEAASPNFKPGIAFRIVPLLEQTTEGEK